MTGAPASAVLPPEPPHPARSITAHATTAPAAFALPEPGPKTPKRPVRALIVGRASPGPRPITVHVAVTVRVRGPGKHRVSTVDSRDSVHYPQQSSILLLYVSVDPDLHRSHGATPGAASGDEGEALPRHGSPRPAGLAASASARCRHARPVTSPAPKPAPSTAGPRPGRAERMARAAVPRTPPGQAVRGNRGRAGHRTARPPSSAVMLGPAITRSSRSACAGPSSTTRASALSRPRRSVAYPVGQLTVRTSSRTDCPTLDREQSRPQAR